MYVIFVDILPDAVRKWPKFGEIFSGTVIINKRRKNLKLTRKKLLSMIKHLSGAPL